MHNIQSTPLYKVFTTRGLQSDSCEAGGLEDELKALSNVNISITG